MMAYLGIDVFQLHAMQTTLHKCSFLVGEFIILIFFF